MYNLVLVTYLERCSLWFMTLPARAAYGQAVISYWVYQLLNFREFRRLFQLNSS